MKPIYFVLLGLFIESGTSQNQRFSQLGQWRNQGTSSNVRQNTLVRSQVTRPRNTRQVGQNGSKDRFAQRNTIGMPQRPQFTEPDLLQQQQPLQSQKIFRPGVSNLPRDAAGSVIRPRAMGRQISPSSIVRSLPQNRLITRTRSRLAASSRPPTRENFDPAVFDKIAMTRRMTRNETQIPSGSGFRGNSPRSVRQTSQHITSNQKQSLSKLNEANTSSAISNSITSTVESERTFREPFHKRKGAPSSRQLGIVAPRERIANRDTTRDFQPPNPIGPKTPKASTGQNILSHKVNGILQGNSDRLRSVEKQASQPIVGRFFTVVENEAQDPTLRRSVTAERRQLTLGNDRLESARQDFVQRLSDRPRLQTQGQRSLAGNNEISSGNSGYEQHISYKVRALLNGEKIDFSLPSSLREDGAINSSVPIAKSSRPLSMIPAREIIQSQISKTPIRADNNLQVSQDNLQTSSSRIQDNSLLTLPIQKSILDIKPRRRTGSWDDVLNVVNTQERQAAFQSPFEDINLLRTSAFNIPARNRHRSHRANTTNEGGFWWETLDAQDNRRISKKRPSERTAGLEMNGGEFVSMVKRIDTETFSVTTTAPSLWSVQRNEGSLAQTSSGNGRSQGSQTGRMFENTPNRVNESQMNELNLEWRGVGTKGKIEGTVGGSSDINFDEPIRSQADQISGRWLSGINTNKRRNSFQERRLDNSRVDGSSSGRVDLGFFGRTSRRERTFDNIQSSMSEDQNSKLRGNQIDFSNDRTSGRSQTDKGFVGFRNRGLESPTAELNRRRPDFTVEQLSRRLPVDSEIDSVRARTSDGRLRETGRRRTKDRMADGRQTDGDISSAFERLINEQSRSSGRRSDRSQRDGDVNTIRKDLPENTSPFDSSRSQESRPPLPSVQQGSPTLSEIQTEPDRISFSSGPRTNPSGPENYPRDRFGRILRGTKSAGGIGDLTRRQQSKNWVNDRDQDLGIRRREPPKTISQGGFDLNLFLETLHSDRSSSEQQPLISNGNRKHFSRTNERSRTMDSGLNLQRSTVDLSTNSRLENTDFRRSTDRGFASERRGNEMPRRFGGEFDIRMERANDAVDRSSTDVIQPRGRTGQDNFSGRQNGLSRFMLPVEARLGTSDAITRSRTQNNEEIQEFNLTAFLESISKTDTPSDSQVSDIDIHLPRRGEARRDRPQEPVPLGPFEDSKRRTRERDQTQMHHSPLRGNDNSINGVGMLFDMQPTNDFTNRPRLRNSDSTIMSNRPRLRQQDSFINVQRQTDSTSEDRPQELSIMLPASNQGQSDNVLGQNSMNVPTATTDSHLLARLAEHETLTTQRTSAGSGSTTEHPRNTAIRENVANQNRWQEPANNKSNRLRQIDDRTNNVRQEPLRQDGQGGLASDSAASNRRRTTTREFDLQAFLASLDVTQAPTLSTVSTTTQIPNLNNIVVNSDPISDPSLKLELNALNLGDTAPFSSNSQMPPPIRQSSNSNDLKTNNEGTTHGQQDIGDSSFLSDLLGLDIPSNILPMGSNVISEIPTLPPTSSSVNSRLLPVNTTPTPNRLTLKRTPTNDTNSSSTENSVISSHETREIRISLDGIQAQRNGPRSPIIVLHIRPDGMVVNNTQDRNQPTERSVTEAVVTPAPIPLPSTSAVPSPRTPTAVSSTIQTTPFTEPTGITLSTTTRITSRTTDEVSRLRAQLNRQNSLLQELIKSVSDKGTGSKITKMQKTPREVVTSKQNAVPSLEDLEHQEWLRLQQQQRPVNRLDQLSIVNDIDAGSNDRLIIQPEGRSQSRDTMNILIQEKKLIPRSRIRSSQKIRSKGPENQLLAINQNTPGLQKRVGNLMAGVRDLILGPNRGLDQSQISQNPMVFMQNQAQANAKQNEKTYNLNSESNKVMSLSQPIDVTFPLNVEPEVVALRAAFDAALFDKLAMTRTMASPSQRSRNVPNRSPFPERRGSANSGIQWLGSDGNRQQFQSIESLSSEITRDSITSFPRESPMVNEKNINDVRLAGVEVPGVISKSLNDLHSIFPKLQTPSFSPSDRPDTSSQDILAEDVFRDVHSTELNLAMRNLLDKVGQDKAVDIIKDIAKSSFDRSTKLQRNMGRNALGPHSKESMGVRVKSQNPNMLLHLLQNENGVNQLPLIATTSEPPRTTLIVSPTTTAPNINLGLIGDSGPLLQKLLQMHSDIRPGKKRRWQKFVNGERMKMQALDLSTLNGRFHPIVKSNAGSKNLRKVQLNLRKKGKRKPVRKQILIPKIPRVQKKSPEAKRQILWAAPIYYDVTTTMKPMTTELKEDASKMNYLKKELNRLMGLLNTMEL